MNIITTCKRQPWNKGKLVGQKNPLRLRDIWAIRVRLQLADRTRDLALFDLAIDSKLRACGLTKLRVRDVAHGEQVNSNRSPYRHLAGSANALDIPAQPDSCVAWMLVTAAQRSPYLRTKDSTNAGGTISSAEPTKWC